MIKGVIFLAFILIISFESTESLTMECIYQYKTHGVLSNVYACQVLKGVTINSRDTAYISSTTGTHQSGHTNNNVNYLYFQSVTISYFPRGLDTLFKNLKGIYFYITGLKEIHQSDLKPFPNLIEFGINDNQIEILEEGLFNFNPNLEYLTLAHSKITHIDSKVFDSLTKLRYLHLQSNPCFNNYGQTRSAVQNLISELKPKCNNSDYYSLDQKLKFLELESKSLNLKDFKLELENLESKVNASKFVNFYQTKLQNLKIILDQKLIDDKNCSTLKVQFLNLITNLRSLTAQISSEELIIPESNQQCMSLNNTLLNFNENILNVNQTVAKLEDQISSLKDSFERADKKLEEFKVNLKEQVELELKTKHAVILEAINKAVGKIEKKMDHNLNIIIAKIKETESKLLYRL